MAARDPLVVPSHVPCGNPPAEPKVIVDVVVKAPRQKVMEEFNQKKKNGGAMVIVNPGPRPVGDLVVGLQMVRKLDIAFQETIVEYDEATGSHKCMPLQDANPIVPA